GLHDALNRATLDGLRPSSPPREPLPPAPSPKRRGGEERLSSSPAPLRGGRADWGTGFRQSFLPGPLSVPRIEDLRDSRGRGERGAWAGGGGILPHLPATWQNGPATQRPAAAALGAGADHSANLPPQGVHRVQAPRQPTPLAPKPPRQSQADGTTSP